jgi:UDP-N-acetylglucosamine transferase subunit ALG13
MAGCRTLFVASTGGHLEELLRLQSRLRPTATDVHWATADTDQSRELLAGETVHWMPMVPPKDWAGAAGCLVQASRVVGESEAERVVSTGAALALPFFVAARLRGRECHYVESAARSMGPSLTGRLSRHVPGVHLYTQYPAWADLRWQFAGSVFDGFEPSHPGRRVPRGGLQRVVVTLGTQTGFSFRRAVEALLRELPAVCAPDVEILWQTGGTDAAGLGIEARASVPPHVLKAAVEEADLVVCHAGVGSALCAMDSGRSPLLVPRQVAFAEHTDDHQVLIAGELERRRLAVRSTPEDLTAETLWRAAQGAVTSTEPGPMWLRSPSAGGAQAEVSENSQLDDVA